MGCNIAALLHHNILSRTLIAISKNSMHDKVVPEIKVLGGGGGGGGGFSHLEAHLKQILVTELEF